jgi:ATP-binding cassette subfamily B protein/subfamily B ATP-binding cassette protein MsbA
VQAFDKQGANRSKFLRLSDDAVDATQKHTLVKTTFLSMNGLINAIGAAIIIYFGGQRVLSDEITVGSLLVFVAYIKSLQDALEGLMTQYGELKSQEASVDRVLEILDSEELVPEASNPFCFDEPAVGHVEFQQVTFGYQENYPVLHELTLEARPGETIAIVGPTGAGKSTAMSLIPRFADPWSGRVTLDGRDLREVQLSGLREQVTLVLQEPFLLPITIAENIAYGRPNAGRDDVVASSVAANAHEFIRRLPEGYDTVIGQRGATLSGGEKQRISIARALLRNSPILILDEPTSALDAETESQVLDALNRLVEGRTTFIIAHRLSTIRKADRIVFLSNGRVAETGSHRELIAAEGPYSTYYSLHMLHGRHEH